FFGWVNGPIAGDQIEWAPSYMDDPSSRRTVATGNITLDLTDYFGSRVDVDEYRNGKVELYVGSGDVTVIVPVNESVTVESYAVNGSIDHADPDRGTRHGPFASGWENFDTTDGDQRQDVYVNIWVASGDVTITQATE